MVTELERAAKALEVCLDLPKDIDPKVLRGEAAVALKLASDGYSRENLKFQISQMLVNRMHQPLDVDGCDKAAAVLLELSNAHRT